MRRALCPGWQALCPGWRMPGLRRPSPGPADPTDSTGRRAQARAGAGRPRRQGRRLRRPGRALAAASRRSLVVRPLTDLARLLPLLAGLLILHARTGGGLVWGIAAAAAAVVTGLVHWATTRYLITDERVYLRHGLLNQKRLSIARDRIRTVDVTAHLLHRMLGVCRVSIGTGRNDLRSGESFHLDGLTRADAEALRMLLLPGAGIAGRQAVAMAGPGGAAGAAAGLTGQPATASAAGKAAGQAAGRAASPGSPARAGGEPWAARPGAWSGQADGAMADGAAEIARLRLAWLRFAPLTLTGLVVLGVLFGAIVQLTNATQINIAKTGTARLIVADYASLSVVQRVLVGGVVAIAGYVLVAVIGYIAVFWNFRLVGDGTDMLRVSRGLLSVRVTTISLSRLRGVEISEPLLLRAARGARCIAITTGLHVGRGAEHEGSMLLPPAPAVMVRDVAASVLGLPEELCSGPLQPHGPRARRRRYVRALAGAAVIVAAICAATLGQHGPTWVWVASFALLPAAAVLAADRYRSLGHRLTSEWLVTRTGTLSRRRSIISVEAIIGWRIHQTWFQRRQGLLTLTATTAAGQQHYSVKDVSVEQGLALAVAATGNLVPPFLMPGRSGGGLRVPGRSGGGVRVPGRSGGGVRLWGRSGGLPMPDRSGGGRAPAPGSGAESAGES